MDNSATTAATPPANVLPPGTRLGEFEVLGLLGLGGFGIVYRALDHALEREVAIKEYMPAMLAGRTETLHVSLRSQSDAEVFEAGRRSFVNEAKLLARFDHPSLLKVYRFWEANDTAYMAMQLYHGGTLRAVRLAMARPPDEPWMRGLLTPLLAALERLHAEGVYHRDIAPDNILIEPDGRPVLLDFGAARRVIGDRSQNLTAILKPAYAPIEQYAEASAVRQGPWTDLYALGATLHFALVGQAPPPSTTRMLHDEMVPLAQRALPGISPGLLQAVDWMLAPRPGDRPQSVAALRAVLDGQVAAPLDWDVTLVQPAPKASDLAPTVVDRPPAARPAPAPDAPAPPAGWAGDHAARRWVPAALGALLVAGAAAFWWWPGGPAPAGPAGPAASAGSAVPVAGGPAASAAAAAPAASAPAVPATVPATVPTTAGASAPPPPPQEVARPAVARPPVPVAPRPAARPEAPADSATLQPQPTPAVVTPPPSAPAARPPAAAAAVPPPEALSDAPSAICGKRVAVAQLICMERECRKPTLAQHPACRKWYAQKPPQQP